MVHKHAMQLDNFLGSVNKLVLESSSHNAIDSSRKGRDVKCICP